LTLAKHKQLPLAFLILLWIIIQTITYFHFEMRASVDSDLYIGIARNLLNGEFPSGRELYYSTYGFLIAIPLAFGLSYEFVLILHFAFALSALICLYKLTYSITQNTKQAFVASLLYVLWFKFQQWNLIVYTDASFAHLVVISIYFLHQANSKTDLGFALLLVLFTAFIRPTGMGFLFAILAYFSFDSFRNVFKYRLKAIAISVVGFSIFLALLNIAMSHYIDWFIESYAKAEIIYPNESLFIAKPSSLVLPKKNTLPIVRLILFFIQNPIYMLKITALKMALFIGHIKPYYSTAHNIFIASFLYPVYFFAIRGFFRFPNGKLKAFIITFLFFQILTVSFTSENWDGRFLLPLLPWIFLLASFGVGRNYNLVGKET
jgi:hypothetical protein